MDSRIIADRLSYLNKLASLDQIVKVQELENEQFLGREAEPIVSQKIKIEQIASNQSPRKGTGKSPIIDRYKVRKAKYQAAKVEAKTKDLKVNRQVTRLSDLPPIPDLRYTLDSDHNFIRLPGKEIGKQKIGIGSFKIWVIIVSDKKIQKKPDLPKKTKLVTELV